MTANDPQNTPAAPQPAPGEPALKGAASKEAGRRGGAPRGNQNALRTGRRRKPKDGHVGSALHKRLSAAEDHTNSEMARVLAELADLHPDWVQADGSLRLNAYTDSLLMELRRNYETDRIAAKQLKDGKDLRGRDLTFEQEQALKKDQRSTWPAIQKCLESLGLTPAFTSGESEEERLDRLWATPPATPEQLAAWAAEEAGQQEEWEEEAS